ncbi:MAG: Bro-N domain-containing protein [Candidatus Omnitrophica bacterium]|nr:Bro-N domain-containing protein [Candidatus Omnitrophota bacterium]
MPKKKKNEAETVHKLAVFKGKQIRRLIHNDEWWFSVIDVVGALTDSDNPRDYWYKMKIREKSESEVELSTNCRQLKLEAPDGKMRQTDCANTEGIFRIIQSIPSPKAEPFKRWLARVGYERIKEIEDPELATKRTRALYKAKGYSDAWIEKRLRGIAIRDELTDEWRKRGIEEQKDYAILTAEISKATFDMTPSEYKKYKKLKRENLRDHMNDLELIFSMLGEASTTEIARNKNAQGMYENKESARQGGSVAGKARRDLEKKSGKRVTSKKNYLKAPQAKKLLKGKK